VPVAERPSSGPRSPGDTVSSAGWAGRSRARPRYPTGRVSPRSTAGIPLLTNARRVRGREAASHRLRLWQPPACSAAGARTPRTRVPLSQAGLTGKAAPRASERGEASFPLQAATMSCLRPPTPHPPALHWNSHPSSSGSRPKGKIWRRYPKVNTLWTHSVTSTRPAALCAAKKKGDRGEKKGGKKKKERKKSLLWLT